MLTLENVILKPLITEKSTHQSNVRNTYSFMVDDRANKPLIKQAIEKLYNVKVAEVRTLVRKGKPRRTRTGYTKTSHWKRAIVVLQEDSKIELF
jgi:large subunit ribosomal protein L23